jgi:protein gp37
MGAHSKIEWTDATWNPLRGVKGKWHCTHVSEGCRNCYAERLNVRLGGPAYKPGADTFRLDDKILTEPLRWKKPRRIFVCSMTDLFHEQVPWEWVDKIWFTMASEKRHQFQVLTKRPERMRDYLRRFVWTTIPTIAKWPLPNVWPGVSVEDQKTADERIPILLQTPAAVPWVSYEPALGLVDFAKHLMWSGPIGPNRGLKWIVCGGESGPAARPMHPDWARSARDQCVAAGVPFFFKQWGEWSPGKQAPNIKTEWLIHTPCQMVKYGGCEVGTFRVGKKAAGRLLDGREWNEYPNGI